MTQRSALSGQSPTSIEEYLRFELDAEQKHEFENGRIIGMAGATGEHSLITMNLGAELRGALKGKPCRVYDGNLRVRIHRRAIYRYPDLQVICGEVQYDPDDTRNMSALNPRLLVEVLSPSTEAYVRGEKFRQYRQVPSLREYVLVSQHAPVIECFFMQEDGTWALATYQDLQVQAWFRSMDVKVAMSEVFAGITFPPEKDESEARERLEG